MVFKLGDTVKVIVDLPIKEQSALNAIGQIVEVHTSDDFTWPYRVDLGGENRWCWFSEKELEGVTPAHKQEEFEKFETGAVRDSQEGKPRYDLISPKFLYRMAMVLTEAAEHYGDHNWHKGIPTSRSLSSLMRHVEGVRVKDDSEDHLARLACNVMFMIEFEGTELDDRYDW